MIEFLNDNSGLTSSILSALSLMLSMVAIHSSIDIAKRETQVSLFDKRLEAYSYIEKCCVLIDCLPSIADPSDSETLFYAVSILLFPLSSIERSLSDRIAMIDTQLAREDDAEIQRSLAEQRASLIRRLSPFCISEAKTASSIEVNITFLFSPGLASMALEILSTYNSFLHSFPHLDPSGIDETVKTMNALSSKIDIDSFLRDMRVEVMSYHC